MKILITGASGLLGRKLFEIMSKTEETAGTYFGNKSEKFHYLDIADKNTVESFFEKIKPEVVIHAAALADADYCEENKEAAKKVNIDGTKNIVDVCKKYGFKMVFISSDYVFDGENGPYTEDSVPNPVNYYGFTKLEGERIVKENLDDCIIIRPAILYGSDEECKASFISQVLNKLTNNEKVVVDNKIVKYPTLTDDVSEAIKQLIDIDARGIYHIAGDEGVTRYEWAIKIAKANGFPISSILPGESAGKAKRPKNVRLDCSKIKRTGILLSAEKADSGVEFVKHQKGCVFKLIYSARPDMLILNQSASAFRISVGKQLAREHPVSADIVIPIPESGIYGATGYSAESKIPFYFGLIRDYFTNKTLFEPTLKMRTASLDRKLVVVPDVVKDKRIILVDEAIVAGTTIGIAIEKLKKAGVKEIHIRIPAPHMLYNCKYKILRGDAELIARRFGEKKEDIEEGLKNHFGVDSLRFISLDGFLGCLSNKRGICVRCFKNDEK